jgi:osmoprotectant transport system permease protein
VRLGFNNSYALAMREAEAARLSLRTLSDLARHPALKLGLSQEFIARGDGWPSLRAAYLLPQTATGLDHGLACEAIAAGKIDVMEIYSTDAKIERYSLRVLEDDRGVFPRYDAVLLYRLDLPQRLPQAWKILQSLEGRIGERQMIRLTVLLIEPSPSSPSSRFSDAASAHLGLLPFVAFIIPNVNSP